MQQHLGIERADVAIGIDRAGRVRNVITLEDADDVDQGVGACQRLGSRSRGRGTPFEQRGQVVEDDFNRRDLLRSDKLAELLQPLVRNLDRADSFAATVRRGAAVTGHERLEDGRLTGEGEADDREVHYDSQRKSDTSRGSRKAA